MGEREPPATLEEALLRILDFERRVEAAEAQSTALARSVEQLSAELHRYDASLWRLVGSRWAGDLVRAGLVRDDVGWIRPGAEEREVWRDLAGVWHTLRADGSDAWATEERAARAWLAARAAQGGARG